MGRSDPPDSCTPPAANEVADRSKQPSTCHIADDKVAGILITDILMRRIHHPYDGGADVFLATPQERDRMRDRHAIWLSRHPSGL
ncbi:DUF3885 domain-containing protein [Streptomyces sp. NPDC001340]